MSYTNLLYHMVIRTRCSRPTIVVEHERELYSYIYAFAKSHSCNLYRIGGIPDHIHILIELPPSVAVSDFMRDLKTSTSKFLKTNIKRFPMFDGWEKEYYASTVSRENKDAVRQYIINQKLHHAKTNLRDELLKLCHDNGVSVDERYI